MLTPTGRPPAVAVRLTVHESSWSAEPVLLADAAGGGEEDGGPAGDRPPRRRRKPTGRKTARQDVAKLRIEMLPDKVKRLGLDAFERVGEESATTLERRVSSLVQVTVGAAEGRSSAPSRMRSRP